MNNFRDDLRYSHTADEMSMWAEVYNAAFPGMLSMASARGDGQLQRLGIDRTVILASGKAVYIDEKVRRKSYGDIALEYVSNDKTGAPGWVTKPLFCDYIAYAIIPTGQCYFLPVPQLQAAWAANCDAWLAQYKSISAVNASYNTLSCPVPPSVLFPAIGKMLRVQFTAISAMVGHDS